MGKKSKVTFILVLLSIVLLPFFMGGCVIPEFIRALIESQTTPISSTRVNTASFLTGRARVIFCIESSYS